jgi:hypothetical protein
MYEKIATDSRIGREKKRNGHRFKWEKRDSHRFMDWKGREKEWALIYSERKRPQIHGLEGKRKEMATDSRIEGIGAKMKGY